MRINNLFNEKKMVFSLEVFPPKVTSSIETIYKMLEELKELIQILLVLLMEQVGQLQVIGL